MIGRTILLVLLGAGSCGPASTPPVERAAQSESPSPGSEATPERGVPEREEDNDPDRPCTMQGRCPAEDLPRFGDALSIAGWARLQEVARRRAVAVRIDGARVRIEEDCELPGEYVEVVRAPESPGRGWASTRLVYTPDEVPACGRATHVVAAFALVDGAERGEAIALPLPCPAVGARATSKHCIGAGLDEADRKAAAQQRWDHTMPAVQSGQPRTVLAELTEMAALYPGLSTYQALALGLGFLASTEFGGCLWLSEAELAAQQFDPEARTGDAPPRPVLQHEIQDCRTRPSLMTCFPERFTPGKGGNCW
jgi:hypothetical protein